jgi:hypothetical protein
MYREHDFAKQERSAQCFEVGRFAPEGGDSRSPKSESGAGIVFHCGTNRFSD